MLLGNQLVRFTASACIAFASAACSGDDQEWTFDKSDMEAAVYGTWHGDYTVTGSEPQPLTLEIQAADPSLTPRCETRTFSEGGELTSGLSPACTAESQLLLSGTLSIEDTSSEELGGYFLVSGMHLSQGEVTFERNTGDFRLSASWRDGAFGSCEVWDLREKLADCTLGDRE